MCLRCFVSRDWWWPNQKECLLLSLPCMLNVYCGYLHHQMYVCIEVLYISGKIAYHIYIYIYIYIYQFSQSGLHIYSYFLHIWYCKFVYFAAYYRTYLHISTLPMYTYSCIFDSAYCCIHMYILVFVHIEFFTAYFQSTCHLGTLWSILAMKDFWSLIWDNGIQCPGR